MQIWITVHEHKHGTDYHLHSTEQGAGRHAALLFKETAKEWKGTGYPFPKGARWPDDDIHELTGGDEYLYIEGPLEVGD